VALVGAGEEGAEGVSVVVSVAGVAAVEAALDTASLVGSETRPETALPAV
jgi:hypothetical protein